ncbi:MAG: S8 family serine peptidase [Tahibacter sp.]
MNTIVPTKTFFRPWLSALAVCAGLVLLPVAANAASPMATSAKVDPSVLQAAAAAPDGKASVLVKLNDQADLSAASKISDWNARGWAVYNALHGAAERAQPEVMARIELARGQGKAAEIKSFWIVNVISLRADRETILELASDSKVAAILPPLKLERPNPKVEAPSAVPQAIEWGITKIRAPDVWTTYGVNGGGVVLANVDTGVQYNHPALVNQYRGNLGGGVFNHNYNWYDPTGATTVPTDDNGHGSHTMGTEVGSDGGANQIGVAPGAKWIAAYGCCPSNDALLEAQQFMLAPTDLLGNNPNPALRPQVVNQSWGGPGGSEIFDAVIASFRASGIFPSFSAGNNGAATAITGCGRLGSPGDNPSAFSVGATDINDLIASFSSRGPNPITGKTGPEVSAPGVTVRSSTPGNAYANLSGTSMASPHVAGAVALLISVEPQLKGQIDQIEEILRKTAVPLTSTQACGGVAGSQIPNNVFGWGRMDIKAAADVIYHAGTIQGTVTLGGTPTAGVTVSFSMLGKTLTTTTDASGAYKVLAGAGSWAMTAAYNGQSASALGVPVTQNNTTTQNFAMPAATSYAVTGTVTQAVTGEAIRALVMVANQDTLPPVWSVVGTGAYNITLPTGTWTLVASHPGYQSVSQVVSAGGTFNLQMTPVQNYTCLDNTDVGGPVYNWTDITDGTAFPLDDDASSANQTLPGTFNYFGTPSTTVRINSNGFLYFGTTTFNTAHMYLPFEGQPNNDVMALGEDMNPALGTQGTIYAKTIGTKFIVQYHQVQHWASGFPETFQIILDTATSQITYLYNTLNNPEFTTAGVENSTGSVGQIYSFRNSANLVAGRAVQFSPASGNLVNWGCDHALLLTAADIQDPVPSGSTITYKLRWNLAGFGGSPQAVLTAILPVGTTFVSASGGITPSGGALTWNLGDQRPKARGEAWFTVTAGNGPLATTSATITDAAGETRSATQSTTIIPDLIFANGFN